MNIATTFSASAPVASPLSPREAAVARLVVHGMPRLQVASTLAISVKTVNNHLSSVFQKLGIKRRAELCALAPQLGLLDPPDGGSTPPSSSES